MGDQRGERMTERVGVVGLGRMGAAMAATLGRAGVPVAGFDIDGRARKGAAVAGLEVTGDLARLVADCPVLLASLPDDAAVTALVEGPGGILAGPGGRLLIDTSTIEPATARSLAAHLQAAGHAMLDAPVSGGPAGAAAGTLTMMIGGSAASLARARPVLDALARTVVHVGDSGAGAVAKLANNLLCAAHLLTTGEALRLARAAGVEPARVLEAVNAASGRSAVSEVNMPRWILSRAFDSGFTMGLMRKDVRLAARLIEALGEAAPLSREVAARWAASAQTLPDDADFNRIAALDEQEG
jgi:3-hydroxyisobutyrate dehydrogenase